MRDNNKDIDVSSEKREQYVQLMTDNLPTLRAKRRLSQAELGELVGVTRQQIVAIKNEKRKMSWGIFLSLVLLFSSYSATRELLEFFGIYSENLFGILEENSEQLQVSRGR